MSKLCHFRGELRKNVVPLLQKPYSNMAALPVTDGRLCIRVFCTVVTHGAAEKRSNFRRWSFFYDSRKATGPRPEQRAQRCSVRIPGSCWSGQQLLTHKIFCIYCPLSLNFNSDTNELAAMLLRAANITGLNVERREWRERERCTSAHQHT